MDMGIFYVEKYQMGMVVKYMDIYEKNECVVSLKSQYYFFFKFYQRSELH